MKQSPVRPVPMFVNNLGVGEFRHEMKIEIDTIIFTTPLHTECLSCLSIVSGVGGTQNHGEMEATRGKDAACYGFMCLGQ